MPAARHLASASLSWIALLATCASSPCWAAAQPRPAAEVTRPNPALPEGRWTGSITSRTIPDVAKDGEWQDEIAVENCAGRTSIQFRRDTGDYGAPIVLSAYPFAKTALLVTAATEHVDGSGWSETQVWTLVDASPKGWTITQSRSVINQQMNPDDPSFTFRRLAWGTLTFDPAGCTRR